MRETGGVPFVEGYPRGTSSVVVVVAN